MTAVSVPETARSWCETGLRLCAFLLPPILALVPHGAAPLAAFAGLSAAGLLAVSPGFKSDALRTPAAVLGALLLWGLLSAIWAIDPERSLILAMRLAGLFVAALVLAAAVPKIAEPARLGRWLCAGLGVAIVLSWVDLASGGGLNQYLSERRFGPARFNQIAVGLAILLLPVSAFLRGRHGTAVALGGGVAMAAVVCLLEDTAAKFAFGLSLVAAACLCRWPVAATRAIAMLCVGFILTAPLALPQLARSSPILAAADRFKPSAGHRLRIWSFVGERITERPLVGWGLDSSRAMPGGNEEFLPGQKKLPLHPHNAALQVWLELGVPGAVLFALFVAWMWFRAIRAAWPPLYVAAAGGSLFSALTAAGAAYGIWQEWWLATLAIAAFLIGVMGRGVAAEVLSATPLPRRAWRGADR